MNIIDNVFDPSTAFQILNFPLATSQHQLDSQRTKIDPEWAAYFGHQQWWIDKGFEAEAHAYQGDASVEFVKYFETADEAAVFAAQFPKSQRIKTSTLTGSQWKLFSARVQFRFQTNGVTGAKNETSIKRFASFAKTVEKLGLEINWVYSYSNSISYAELSEGWLV